MTDWVLPPACSHLHPGAALRCLPRSAPFHRPACCHPLVIFAVHFHHFIPPSKTISEASNPGFCFLKKSAVPWFSLLDLPAIPSSHLLQPSVTSLPPGAGAQPPCCCCCARGFLPCPSLARLTSFQVPGSPPPSPLSADLAGSTL